MSSWDASMVFLHWRFAHKSRSSADVPVHAQQLYVKSLQTFIQNIETTKLIHYLTRTRSLLKVVLFEEFCVNKIWHYILISASPKSSPNVADALILVCFFYKEYNSGCWNFRFNIWLLIPCLLICKMHKNVLV